MTRGSCGRARFVFRDSGEQPAALDAIVPLGRARFDFRGSGCPKLARSSSLKWYIGEAQPAGLQHSSVGSARICGRGGKDLGVVEALSPLKPSARIFCRGSWLVLVVGEASSRVGRRMQFLFTTTTPIFHTSLPLNIKI